MASEAGKWTDDKAEADWYRAFGERLRRARADADVCSEGLSGVLGFSKSWLSSCELGLNRPKVRDVIRIAEELEASVPWLLGLDPRNENGASDLDDDCED